MNIPDLDKIILDYVNPTPITDVLKGQLWLRGKEIFSIRTVYHPFIYAGRFFAFKRLFYCRHSRTRWKMGEGLSESDPEYAIDCLVNAFDKVGDFTDVFRSLEIRLGEEVFSFTVLQ